MQGQNNMKYNVNTICNVKSRVPGTTGKHFYVKINQSRVSMIEPVFVF
jgi:hypothetical protein